MSFGTNPHTQHTTEALIKTVPAMIPGGVTVLADLLDIINTSVSIIFLSLSAAFLIWRWRVSYNRQKVKDEFS